MSVVKIVFLEDFISFFVIEEGGKIRNRIAFQNRIDGIILRYMPSITLRDIPVELHAQLRNEADANYRSIADEVMSRIERTFQIDAELNNTRDQKWIDEAIAAGRKRQ